MGWIDREYSRSNYDRGGVRGAVMWLLGGSVWLGRWFDINVRVHASLVVLIVLNMLLAETRYGIGVGNALASSAILFGIILLHEFGHCLAARKVGGDAEEILLWPLGGLAYVSTPRRPWPTFVGVAGGPLVNVVICAITGIALLAMSGGRFVLPWNPLLIWSGNLLADESFLFAYSSTAAYYLWWIYSTSWMLLFFNLLPIFPLDGGRILQTILWPFIGYFRSMNFACITGMIAAVIMGLVGIATSWFLVFLAYSGFFTCYQTRMTLRESADAAWSEEHFSDGGWNGFQMPRVPRPKRAQTPRDDRRTLRDFSPLEWIARRRRRKQFERLMKDD